MAKISIVDRIEKATKKMNNLEIAIAREVKKIDRLQASGKPHAEIEKENDARLAEWDVMKAERDRLKSLIYATEIQ